MLLVSAREELVQSVDQLFSAVEVVEDQVLGDVGDACEAVRSYLFLDQVFEQAGHDFYDLEALYQVVLVGSHEGKVPKDQDYGRKVL
jgi:hypothetical protein